MENMGECTRIDINKYEYFIYNGTKTEMQQALTWLKKLEPDATLEYVSLIGIGPDKKEYHLGSRRAGTVIVLDDNKKVILKHKRCDEIFSISVEEFQKSYETLTTDKIFAGQGYIGANVNKAIVFKIIQDWIRNSDVSRGYVTPTTDPYDCGFKVELIVPSSYDNEEVIVSKVFQWNSVLPSPFTKVKTNENIKSLLNNELQKMYESIKE